MKECFGYVRVSTAKQGEGVSLEAQRDAILRFAERSGLNITQWFEEKETAAKTGRPIFTAMIKALHAGKAAGVVMHKIDRSARNFADWARIGDLADAGIDIHFATESLDFRSRGGRLAADIQAVVAADYVRNLREEAIKGLTGRLKQGIYPFRAPIGYLDNGSGKVKTFDPVRAPLVRHTFELYATGAHSLISLRDEMARRGLRNVKGRPLTKSGIEATLANPFYCGLIRIKRSGETYAGAHDPLIPPRLFDRVQEVRVGKAGKKVTRHNHTYRGLFNCGCCGRVMTPERQKGRVYYRCHDPTCPTTAVRENAIEVAIMSALAEARLSDSDIEILVTRTAEWCAARRKNDRTEPTKLQLAQIGRRLDRLVDAVVDGLIDHPTYTRRKEALLLEKLRLEDLIARTEDQRSDADQVGRFLELAKSLTATYAIADPLEKRWVAEIATSNRLVAGREVLVEPANWLISGRDALSVLNGGDRRDTSRTSVAENPVEKLISAAQEIVQVFKSGRFSVRI